MRKLLLVIFLFCLPVYVLKAEESCAADVSKYSISGLKKRKSVFSKSNDGSVLPSKLIEYGFEDRIALKNGIEVIYVSGGCAHYGYRFIFKGSAIKKMKKQDRLSRAELLLKELKSTNTDEKDILLKALSKAKSGNLQQASEGVWYLPCGDATCELVDKDNDKIEIGYSFAL